MTERADLAALLENLRSTPAYQQFEQMRAEQVGAERRRLAAELADLEREGGREAARLSRSESEARAKAEAAQKALDAAKEELQARQRAALSASMANDHRRNAIEASLRATAPPKLAEFRRVIAAAAEEAWRHQVIMPSEIGPRTGYLPLSATNRATVEAARARILALHGELDALALLVVEPAALDARLAKLSGVIEEALAEASQGVPSDWIERAMADYREALRRRQAEDQAALDSAGGARGRVHSV